MLDDAIIAFSAAASDTRAADMISRYAADYYDWRIARRLKNSYSMVITHDDDNINSF